jgi:hypothetical protein
VLGGFATGVTLVPCFDEQDHADALAACAAGVAAALQALSFL